MCLHDVFMNEDLRVLAGGRDSRLHYEANRARNKAITAQPSEPLMLFHSTSVSLLAHLGECFRNYPGFMHWWSTAYASLTISDFLD